MAPCEPNEATHGGGENLRAESMTVRLEWEGKPAHVERISLPFQTVETINELRATRRRDTGAPDPTATRFLAEPESDERWQLVGA